jgi:hypothetical protein
MNTIQSICDWHAAARPQPTSRDFSVQLGCHFEEVAEMIDDLTFHVGSFEPLPGGLTVLAACLKLFADQLKSGETVATVNDPENFLKELCDQVVTAAGVAHCAGMAFPRALSEVHRSNFSKMENGKFLRDENGKIIKGEHYRKPNLEGMW